MNYSFIGAILAGATLLCSFNTAQAFDKEAATKLLNPDETNQTASDDATSEQDFIERQKNEFFDQQPKERKDVEVRLPQECNLISYTSDGASSRYRCKDYEILTVLMLPNEKLTTEKFAKELSLLEECEALPDNNLGLSVSCDTPDGKYVTYFIDLPSRLTENLITSVDYNDPAKIEAISNVSHSIYFYIRHIAKNQEQIKYLTELMNQAAMIKVDTKSEKAGNNSQKTEK